MPRRNRTQPRCRRVIAIVVMTFGLSPVLAISQSYPTKPVRVVVGFSPGGTADLLARMLGQRLSEQLGQPVIVDNRPGANAIIGANLVAKAAPDGYVVLLQSVVHAINPGLYAKLPYDTIAEFTPIILVAAGQLILVVHPSFPVRSVKELTAFVKARPGQLNYASGGNGSAPHLAMELYKSMAGGLQITQIPYKGAGPALTDVLGGQIPLMFAPIVPSLPHVNAGTLRALAIGARRRATSLPELPTMEEAGLSGYEASAWLALFAPAKTPREIVVRLNNEVAKILKAPEMRERLTAQGADPIGGTPEQLGEYVKIEIAKWGKVIHALGLQAE